jgi:hypothetical protein
MSRLQCCSYPHWSSCTSMLHTVIAVFMFHLRMNVCWFYTFCTQKLGDVPMCVLGRNHNHNPQRLHRVACLWCVPVVLSSEHCQMAWEWLTVHYTWPTYLSNNPYIMWELWCHTDSTLLLNMSVFTVTEGSIWVSISRIATENNMN